MNPAKHTIRLSFGNIKIVDFPKEATSFFDFPDGRLLVNRPLTKEDRESNPGKSTVDLMAELANAGEIIHYQLDLHAKERNARTRLSKDKLEGYAEEMRMALKAYIFEMHGEERVIHSGTKNVDRLILTVLSPNSINKRSGSSQVIQGVSGTDIERGTNRFELYLPRGIKVDIRGLRSGLERRSYTDFTGTLRFAKKDYQFTVMANDYGWNNFGPQTNLKPAAEEIMREHYQNMFRMIGVISRECVAEQITKMLWHAFPFIREYDMLDNFVFDPLMKLDEKMEHWKDLRANSQNYCS